MVDDCTNLLGAMSTRGNITQRLGALKTCMENLLYRMPPAKPEWPRAAWALPCGRAWWRFSDVQR